MAASPPIVVEFRFDAASPEDAQAVIAAIAAAGIAIVPKHTHRPKKRGEAGVFWHGSIVVGGDTTVHAEAERLRTAQALPSARRSLPAPRRTSGRRIGRS